MLNPRLSDLMDLSLFVKKYSGKGGKWKSDGPDSYVYRTAHERITIRFDRRSWINDYAMWREERLRNAGICTHENDSRQFVRTLLASVSDHLSIRDLEHLCEAAQSELQRRLRARDVVATPDI